MLHNGDFEPILEHMLAEALRTETPEAKLSYLGSVSWRCGFKSGYCGPEQPSRLGNGL